jgi:predicted aspartyl protease
MEDEGPRLILLKMRLRSFNKTFMRQAWQANDWSIEYNQPAGLNAAGRRCMFDENGERIVGRFHVKIEVANNEDVILADKGLLDPGKVRRCKLRALVDCGATRLVLPETVVKTLGLPVKRVRVRYADRRIRIRDAVSNVYLDLMDRNGVFTATVEPKRRTALIGAIVLEDLDFLIAPSGERLVPRDPKYVVSEIE